MRLIDHLARRRQIYPRALPTLPDILLIDIPADYARGTLPLERYYPVVLETGAEHREMEAFLRADRAEDILPSLFDRRPSALHSEDIIFARYAPPLPEWPWALLCCWPLAYTAMVPLDIDYFARSAYTIEIFATHGDLEEAEAVLLSNLRPYQVRHVGHGCIPAGTA